jgi:TP53 regulating kinase-like protein
MPFLNGQDCVVKERLKKTYRHPVLDEKLTHRRVVQVRQREKKKNFVLRYSIENASIIIIFQLQEARAMRNCRKAGIDAPTVYLIDTVNSSIYMEYIEGPSLRDYIMSTGQQMTAEKGKSFLRDSVM